ncbi:hypothetical protein SKAU_G00354740 [Synaphobranchus kaupii]|uniref:EF-hand domain-containing protein n=1 Tax=Synaphobranchus kaupii TaxID=118154 RepID=A0A9Q1EH31_SYNKA|nr:hypothetical protein SKAU_G00354740 [Synaphobranchus kaupii]
MAAAAVEVSVSSGSSDTSSTGEEERMRRLFQTCDGDGDGYISRNDLLMVCRQLNMEESVAEIMDQLGADERGKISFQDFTRCRMQLVSEIRKEEGALSLLSDSSDKRKLRDRVASWPTSSENSLGALSGARESWEYDSGARDLQSPDLQQHAPPPQTQPVQPALQKLLEQRGAALDQQAALHKLVSQTGARFNPLGGNYLELANTAVMHGAQRAACSCRHRERTQATLLVELGCAGGLRGV